MKKVTFALILFAASFISKAQEGNTFKPFKVDLAMGYAIPSGDGAKGGIVLATEPKYAINDQITVGLRLEAALTARASVDQNGEYVTGDVKASGSYLITGDYYFNTNKFRPFAGLGTGLYKLASVEFKTDQDVTEGDIKSGSKFGAAPRVGFEFGHFRTAIEYNVIGKTEKIKNNYLSIKLGFFIGGGRL